MNINFKVIDMQDDLMVITVKVGNFIVMKTLIDQDCSMDILYYMNLKRSQIPEIEVQSYDCQIMGFSREGLISEVM